LNDPLPEFRIRSWQLRGLRTATPGLTSKARSFPANYSFQRDLNMKSARSRFILCRSRTTHKIQQGVNSFTQLDWLVTDRQLVTATLHLAPRRLSNWTINYFNPIETSPDARTHNYSGTIADRVSIGSSYWENTVSCDELRGIRLAEGAERALYYAGRATTATTSITSTATAPLESPRFRTSHWGR
jgi:hypothetical protein